MIYSFLKSKFPEKSNTSFKKHLKDVEFKILYKKRILTLIQRVLKVLGLQRHKTYEEVYDMSNATQILLDFLNESNLNLVNKLDEFK